MLSQYLCILSVVFAYSPVVKELQDLLNQNLTLKSQLEQAISASGDRGMDLDGFYQVVDAWNEGQAFNQSQSSALSQPFTAVIDTQMGADLGHVNEFVFWLRKFVMSRGAFLSTAESAVVVPSWEQVVNMSEFVIPAEGFTSYNSWFGRRIKAGARPIAGQNDHRVVVNPVDCTLWEELSETLATSEASLAVSSSSDKRLVIKDKGIDVNVYQLLNNSKFAKLFANGSAYRFTLFPVNYHHAHSPVSGTIVSCEVVGDVYFFSSFDPESQFRDSHRGIIIIDTQDHGLIAIILIAFSIVGSLLIAPHVTVGASVVKGQELATFLFGGSDVVLLFGASYPLLPPTTSAPLFMGAVFSYYQ